MEWYNFLLQGELPVLKASFVVSLLLSFACFLPATGFGEMSAPVLIPTANATLSGTNATLTDTLPLSSTGADAPVVPAASGTNATYTGTLFICTIAPAFFIVSDRPAANATQSSTTAEELKVKSTSGAPQNTQTSKEGYDPAWESLITRLTGDGFDKEEVQSAFARLGLSAYSPAFMAAKILELHGVGGIGIHRDNATDPNLPEGYVQPVPDTTLGNCKAFITEYSSSFGDIQKKYGVSPSIIVAILLVETNLGHDLGSDVALRVLGSMAATVTPAMLGSEGNAAQVRRIPQGALAATLRNKSTWAYGEVKALLTYGKKCTLDLSTMPGSIYGAIGICQFMPSNIEPYGIDGNEDGKVDLFSVPDALYSVANYLSAHGWRANAGFSQKFQVIRAYNQDNFYAAKVLAVAQQIEMALQGKVSDARSATAGVGPIPASVLDPSLRRRARVPAAGRIKYLESYQQLLQ